MEHIHPIQPIAAIILIAVFLYMRRQKKLAAEAPAKAAKAAAEARAARPAKQEQPPEVVYMNLRQRAFNTSPDSLGPSADIKAHEAYGLLMEMGISNSVITLACFADGEAGLYYQTGGGMIGGGAHENVRRVAREFLGLAHDALPSMSPATDQALPEAGRVRFYALTPEGLLMAEMDREDLGESPGAFSTLFYKGQEVVNQMRQVQQQRAG